METVALRQFDPLYILFDTLFLIFLACLLIRKKQYAALLAGSLAGILYMLVDFGIFHLLCHARSISQGHSLFWVLFWMSMSYGFTNFAWIWLWVSRDKDLKEWSFLIILWWFVCPLLTKTFGGRGDPIVIQRTTGAYHGYMALLLFAGYLFLILWNMKHENKNEKMPLFYLLTMGILVQFGWEFMLLLGGVRSAGFEAADMLRTLLTDSLLETNLGMPYIYLIYLWFSSKYTQQMKKRKDPVSLTEALRESNEKNPKKA